MKIPLLTFARHKFVYVLLTLLFLALVYRDVLMTYFFFDIHAPDLAKFDGQAIKNDLLKSALDFRILQFNLGFYQSFIIPIIIVLLGFQYIELKNKVLRLSIGREVSYQGLKRKLTLQVASIPCLIYLVTVLIIAIITYFFGTFSPLGWNSLLDLFGI
ncbi:membrane protein [Streptococcus pneumoniae]|nr:membrane protein [Streptococcus pneumoniae]